MNHKEVVDLSVMAIKGRIDHYENESREYIQLGRHDLALKCRTIIVGLYEALSMIELRLMIQAKENQQ